MDQVFFAVKRAHHAVLKFSRRALARFGVTPARFDMMQAIMLFDGATQLELRKWLGLARSSVSEMLAALERTGLIWRMRHRRTRMVFLSQKGEALFERVFDACLNTGDVPVMVDGVLTDYDAEKDSLQKRFEVHDLCARLRSAFGDSARSDLYPWWHPDEWLEAIHELVDLSGDAAGS